MRPVATGWLGFDRSHAFARKHEQELIINKFSYKVF